MVNSNMEIVHDGWLLKSPPPKRLWRAKWRNRWFVLRSGDLPGQYFLEYYTDDSLKKLKGKIDLDQCEQVDAGITFAQTKFNYKFMFDIKTPKRVYYLCTETEEQMNRWVDCVCQVCGLKVMAPDDQYDPLSQLASSLSINSQIPNPSLAFDPVVDSPPPSASSVISGPYIPISECITGKKISNTKFPFTQEMEENTKSSCIPNEMAPSAPISFHNGIRGVKSRESYDMPRQLRPSATSEESSSIQSPLSTESSNLFSDELSTPSLGKDEKFSVGKEIPPKIISQSTNNNNGGESPPPYQAPPRPPKPPHLADGAQSYMNLEAIMRATKVCKNSSDENNKNCEQPMESSVSSSDPEASPNSPKEPTMSDSMYDFPRLHQAELIVANSSGGEQRTRRHCYNNAAPGQAPGKVFCYDKEAAEMESRISPLLANFSPSTATLPPPAVDRGTKPKISESYTFSGTDLSPPPSGGTVNDDISFGAVGGIPAPPASAPPIVDRNRRKPAKKMSESSISGDFVLEPAPRSRLRVDTAESGKLRSAPSPTQPSLRNGGRSNDSDTDADSLSSPSSRRNSAIDEQVFFPLHMVQRRLSNTEIQYLDLDLIPQTPLPQGSPKLTSGGASSTTAVKCVPSESSIVYKKVDFVKTEAFNKMRLIVDEEYRKYQE